MLLPTRRLARAHILEKRRGGDGGGAAAATGGISRRTTDNTPVVSQAKDFVLSLAKRNFFAVQRECSVKYMFGWSRALRGETRIGQEKQVNE